MSCDRVYGGGFGCSGLCGCGVSCDRVKSGGCGWSGCCGE